MKSINVVCTGAELMNIDDMIKFQHDLKNLSDENYQKIKLSITDLGFSEPICIWKNENKNYIIGGHQRHIALNKMREEGYEIPLIPVSLIEADNIKQAKKKVLALTSQFGAMTQDGLINFCKMNELNIDDIMKEFVFPEIPSILIEDFSEKNKEIDTDLFSAEMELKLKYSEENYMLVKNKLLELADTPEKALLKLLEIE
jgi:hypothetical protein